MATVLTKFLGGHLNLTDGWLCVCIPYSGESFLVNGKIVLGEEGSSPKLSPGTCKVGIAYLMKGCEYAQF